jgi:hypothetical protein
MVCGGYRVSAQRPSLWSSLYLAGMPCRVVSIRAANSCCGTWDVDGRNLRLGALMQLGPAALRGEQIIPPFQRSAGSQKSRQAVLGDGGSVQHEQSEVEEA